MRAGGSASRLSLAFHHAEPGGGGGASRSRQLRLVEEERRSVGASQTPAAPTRRPDDSGVPAVSLADYLVGLVVGDSCFCCGAALVEAEESVPAWSGGTEGGTRRLECGSCGASLEGPWSVV